MRSVELIKFKEMLKMNTPLRVIVLLLMLSFATMLFFSCDNSNEVFYENIHVGDHLEKCLANGSVQYNTNANINTLELTHPPIFDVFLSSNLVKFDEKNIVKELELSYSQRKDNGTGQYEDKKVNEVFNFMTQYFCQRYVGMKTEGIKEIISVDECDICEVKLEKKGMRNIWETKHIKIILSTFEINIRDRNNVYSVLNRSLYTETGDYNLLGLEGLMWETELFYRERKVVELKILAK